jgi:signal peptidase I
MLQPSVKFKKIGPRKPPQALWKAYVQACAAAFFVALVLRAFVIQAYRIPTGSMEDTVMAGDFVMVNKLAYTGSKVPQVGDVIVFAYPLNPDRDFVKRVIAVGGQEVALRDKLLYVDGALTPMPPAGKNIDAEILSSVFSNRDNFGPVLVPQGSYFVMGDNRDDSEDSRFWGTVPDDHVKGRVSFVYWSWAPAPDAPQWEFPYIHSFFGSLWYNTTHLGDRLRLDRIGHSID